MTNATNTEIEMMTQAATQIKKGDSIYLFTNWDNKGTWAWYGYVVNSAGKVQIHLRSIDGDMLKRRIYRGFEGQRIRLISEVADPDAFAVELAQRYLTAEIAACKLRIEQFAHQLPYVKNQRGRLAELESATAKSIRRRLP